MLTNKKDIQILVDLGLTVLQAKVYITLLQIGRAKVRMISESSKISRPDIYRIIPRLQQLGLIEKQVTNPVMFEAVSPKIVINSLLKHKKMDFNELESKSKRLIPHLEKTKKRKTFKDKDFFVIVPSHETLISRLNQEIKKTKNTIEIVTTCKRLQYACYCFSESLNEVWKHNVKCRVLIEKPSMDQKAMFRKCYPKPWADIRFLSGKPSTVVAIFDNSEVFIITRSNTALKESPALWSNNEGILSITRNYLEALWKDATVLENMILESPSK